MLAIFDTIEALAAFNSKPHLFTASAPFCGDDDGIYCVSLESGSEEIFAARVEQFGGSVM